ncbi:hypothetical protein PMAYCL1PPCAC_07715, partial [Pristionchus mayeri]
MIIIAQIGSWIMLFLVSSLIVLFSIGILRLCRYKPCEVSSVPSLEEEIRELREEVEKPEREDNKVKCHTYITYIPNLLNNFTAIGAMIEMFRIRVYFTVLSIVLFLLCPFDLFSENNYSVLGSLDDASTALLAMMYLALYLTGRTEDSTGFTRSDIPILCVFYLIYYFYSV